jgi:arsenite-transporting ATPase
LEENWSEIQRHAVEVLNWAGLAEVEAEELSVVPGLDELFSLADVKRHHDEGPYDVLVVDCAPTGETLRLLSLPDVVQWYMERIFPVERRVMGALRPMARRLTALPLPGEDVYRAVARFYDRLEGVKQVLTDPASTSVRLVVNPEHMVIAEARRTFTYLSLFGYRVDAVIVNRLLPDEVVDPYFERWKVLQAEHMETIRESFSPLPILRAHLRDREIAGLEPIVELGDELYADADAGAILHTDDPMGMRKEGDDFVMSLRLPFASKDDLELSTKADELYVKVGRYRRTIILPRMLAVREPSEAKMTGDRIEIRFREAARP